MSSRKKKSLLVVDAHAMAYRAYFAMNRTPLTHPVTGLPTGAIFGFFRMLIRLLLDHSPTHCAVVWNPPGGSFRNQTYPEYKAHRSPMPDDLRSQIEEIQELSGKMALPLLQVTGYEADDVMGTLAHRFGEDFEVILITGDKDCYQLLDKKVTMYRPLKGVTEFTRITPEWVREELEIGVEVIPDYMALVGDASDNIPGAKGIGPKGAAKLIQEFGNLNSLYQNLEKVKPEGTKKKLIDSKKNVYLSLDLATIRKDVPLVLELDPATLVTPNILTESIALEFRNQGYNQIYNELQRARKNSTEESTSPSGEKGDSGSPRVGGKATADRALYHLIQSTDELENLVKELSIAQILSVDTETDNLHPMKARLVGVSLARKAGEAWYVALPAEDSLFLEKGIHRKTGIGLLKKLLENKKIRFVGQNIKYDWIVLKNHGIELPGIDFDTMIASYLLNPGVRRHNLDDMALDHLGHDTIKYEEVTGKGRNKLTMDQIPPEQIRDYACEDADISFRLYEFFEPELKKASLEGILREIELPLIPVLARMEMAGVAIDAAYFRSISDTYAKELKKIESEIHEISGFPFNLNSTRELQKFLFEDLQLPHGKKTKTGYSTDQSVLETLRGLHPAVDRLLEHRKLSKLKSTYLDALPELIHPRTGRIHTSFNQTIAATGRLSSNDPNLQNIPIREEAGRAIRRGFIPTEGNLLLGLDYSQIELRIMAHYSKDPGLMEAFTKDHVDIHARTAASLFGVPETDVDPDMRSKAKVVNFSIIYGVTDFGLAQNLGISRPEAGRYIERFFERYPGVKKYMDETIAFAEKTGYVETITGRRRQVPEINASNRFRKEGARRAAINSPIQGTSADIIKKAMIQIDRDLIKKKMKSKMILQVHDELLFDVIPEEREELTDLVRKRMEGAERLLVPLQVDARFGKNWDEAH